jgi:hypothetical protein
MKRIKKDELYENLGHFLKSKGIELKEGGYTKGVHAGCSFLADAINLSQAGIARAKAEIDRKLDLVRQVIHEQTAPKPPVIRAAGSSAAARNSKPPRKYPSKAARENKPKSRPSKSKRG